MRTILVRYHAKMMMTNPPANSPAASSPPTETNARPRIDSGKLLQGANALEIDHSGQRYLLRVTRENKLILTK